MKIKKGDNVKMLTGKDRGKTGKVLSVLEANLPAEKRKRVIVEGLNMAKRHQRAKREGQKGQIISREQAVDGSNVQLICPKCGKPTRIGSKVSEKGKTRICKKCKAEI